jgi:hypothetical protein
MWSTNDDATWAQKNMGSKEHGLKRIWAQKNMGSKETANACKEIC